jgi:hypothetical protein
LNHQSGFLSRFADEKIADGNSDFQITLSEPAAATCGWAKPPLPGYNGRGEKAPSAEPKAPAPPSAFSQRACESVYRYSLADITIGFLGFFAHIGDLFRFREEV